MQKSSPISSGSSDSASDGYIYYVDTTEIRNNADTSPISSLRCKDRRRRESWEALPGPAHGLYLHAFDAVDSEEYMSDSGDAPIRTEWTPVKRQGRKFSSAVLIGIDKMLAFLSMSLVCICI